MSGRLLRTLRLDESDRFVFGRPALPGEWAVPGSFMFWAGPPELLEGKARAAFRSGFLGAESFGWSTLAVVVEAAEAERQAAVVALAEGLCRELGAPDLATAMPAATEEIAFAGRLAEQPPGTLVALARTVEGGAVRERFRTLRPRGGLDHGRAFDWLEQAGDEAPIEPLEDIDLVRIAGSRR